MSDRRLIPDDIDLTADKHLSHFWNSSEETDRFLFGKRSGVILSNFVRRHLDADYYGLIKSDNNEGICFQYINDYNSLDVSSIISRVHRVNPTSWSVTTQQSWGNTRGNLHFMWTESNTDTSTTINFDGVDLFDSTNWTSTSTSATSTSVVFENRIAYKDSDKNQFGETESAFEIRPGQPLNEFMQNIDCGDEIQHVVKFSDFIDDVYDDQDFSEYMRLDELVIRPENVLRSRESNIIYVKFRSVDGDIIATGDTTIHDINEFVTGINFAVVDNNEMLAL